MEHSGEMTVENEYPVFVIGEWDVQEMARMQLGRALDSEEMYHARKAVNWGFESWYEIIQIAVEQAVEEAREKRLGL